MTHQEIFNKWIGKKYCESKELWAQCVWFVKLFAQEVWFPVKWFSGSALRWWETGSPFVGTEWVRVENSISAVPTSGSIIFFDKTPKNPYGHVAVVDSADVDLIILVEQNAGSGNGNGIGANAITRRTVGYTARAWRGKCLGWYTMPIKKQDPIIKEDNTTQSKFKEVYEKELTPNYVPTFSTHDDPTPATVGDIKYLIEINNIRLLKKGSSI